MKVFVVYDEDGPLNAFSELKASVQYAQEAYDVNVKEVSPQYMIWVDVIELDTPDISRVIFEIDEECELLMGEYTSAIPDVVRR